MVTKNDHRQAIAADSVAVNIPLRIPPMMMTTVISPHSVSMKIFSAWRNGTRSPFGYPRLCANITHITISVRLSSRPGRIPAMNSAAIDTVPPVASE
ncbi:hypothetical protein D3C80_1779110 [compost metagenome]